MKQMIRANPILRRLDHTNQATIQTMGLRGVMIKTLILCCFVYLGVLIGYLSLSLELIPSLLVISSIAAIVSAIAMIFFPRYAGIGAPIYAVVEGIVLGIVATSIELVFPGIVWNGLLLTIALLVAMVCFYLFFPTGAGNLVPYISGITGAITIVYACTFLLRLFGLTVPYVDQTGLFGIIIAFFLLALATLNLFGDFTYIHRQIDSGSGKEYEWYAAFGLIVTLVWIYFRVLDILIMLVKRKEAE